MAKAAQVAAAAPARLIMTEVAPPPVVTVMRLRKAPRSLDTIAEDDREQLLASPSDYGFAAAAWSLKRMPTPRERAGGFVMTRDLGKYFSDAHHGSCQASGWEGGHKLGLRRAVHAQEELHKVVARRETGENIGRV